MITISTTYALVWRFKKHKHIQITRCKKVINTQTMRIKKKCLNGGSVGYWLTDKEFIPICKITLQIEKIPKKEILPF